MESGLDKKDGRSWRFWAALVVIAITVLFIAVNAQKVTVDFIVGDAELPLVFALSISVALGFVLGYVLPRLRSDKKD